MAAVPGRSKWVADDPFLGRDRVRHGVWCQGPGDNAWRPLPAATGFVAPGRKDSPDGGVAAAGRVANAPSGGTGRGGGDTETWLGPPAFLSGSASVTSRSCGARAPPGQRTVWPLGRRSDGVSPGPSRGARVARERPGARSRRRGGDDHQGAGAAHTPRFPDRDAPRYPPSSDGIPTPLHSPAGHSLSSDGH